MKKIKIRSFKDSRGRAVINCGECERGYNGILPEWEKNKCSCGFRKYKGCANNGCFSGVPMAGIVEALEKMENLPSVIEK